MIAGAASYVDRILRCPAELPVQGPTEFELVVRQKAVRNSACNSPPALLARADEVISRDAMSASGCGHAKQHRDVRCWGVVSTGRCNTLS